MSPWSCISWTLLTFAFASVTNVAASWHSAFNVRANANLQVKAGDNYIHFTCNGLTKTNTWSRVSLPEMPSAGATTSFFIEVLKIEETREVKFALFEDVILRWRKNGMIARWVVWEDNRFKTLANSAILPGTSKHSVTFVRSGDGFSVFEDGNLVAEYSRPKSAVSPTFSMQSWDRGSSLDISITSIQIHKGVFTSSHLATT